MTTKAAVVADLTETKEAIEVKELAPARNHRLPACIVAYQTLLQGTCAANCGQPLVGGAGPGFTKTRVVLDGETTQWYHIRCYDTCSEDQWAKHTSRFTDAPDSKFHDEEHAVQCRDVVRHWTFLRDLTADDLAVQCTPWTTCLAPSHLDRMILHIGSDYAARSVWPDAVVAHRPGPFQPFYEQMFSTAHFTHMALVWRTEVSGDSDALIRTGLSHIARLITDAVAALQPLGPQLYVQPRFYRATDQLVYLRVTCQAVHGSELYYEPFTILARGSMAAQMRHVASLLDNLAKELLSVIQTVLDTAARTVTEVRLHKPWALQAQQYRCYPTTKSEQRIELPVGLSVISSSAGGYAYVAVGRHANSLIQLYVEPTHQTVYVPFDIPRVDHRNKTYFSDILHADKVHVTPMSVIALASQASAMSSSVLPSVAGASSLNKSA